MTDDEWEAQQAAARRVDPDTPMQLYRAEWRQGASGEFYFLAPDGNRLAADLRAEDLMDRGIEGNDVDPHYEIEYVEPVIGPPTAEQHRLAEAWKAGRPW